MFFCLHAVWMPIYRHAERWRGGTACQLFRRAEFDSPWFFYYLRR